MPSVTRRGVTFTEAWQEAAAVAPVGRAMLAAYELWHPSLAEPIRFVNDTQDLEATLEADAPRNAGETVTFIACPVSMKRPEESDTAASPELELSRPEVAGIMNAALKAAAGSLVPWTLIEREFASDDTSGPARLPPLELELSSVTMGDSDLSIAAQFDDDFNLAIPRLTFKRSEYPGLLR